MIHVDIYEEETKAMNLNAVFNRRGAAKARLSIIAVLLGLTLVGCSGYAHLLELSQTAEQYFNSFDFAYDLAIAVDFAEKVLGSGAMP